MKSCPSHCETSATRQSLRKLRRRNTLLSALPLSEGSADIIYIYIIIYIDIFTKECRCVLSPGYLRAATLPDWQGSWAILPQTCPGSGHELFGSCWARDTLHERARAVQHQMILGKIPKFAVVTLHQVKVDMISSEISLKTMGFGWFLVENDPWGWKLLIFFGVW